MKFLALEHERLGVNKSEFTQYLNAEARCVWDLYQTGTIREIYFRADQSCAVLILESPDIDSARASLATLPLVQADLIDFELIPLVPYPGFARLFASEQS